MELDLLKRSKLGNVRAGVQGLLDLISPGATLPDESNVPEVLKPVVKNLTSADVTIDRFHLIIPGEDYQNKQKLFTVGLQATWYSGEATLFGGVKLRGLYVKVSNEETSADLTSTEETSGKANHKVKVPKLLPRPQRTGE